MLKMADFIDDYGVIKRQLCVTGTWSLPLDRPPEGAGG
jgi:hypothetical protein